MVAIEAIINGGFEYSEAGNPYRAQGWTEGHRNNSQHHSGDWCWFLYEDATHQTIDLSIPVADITAFGFWTKGNGGDAGWYIHYTDDSITNGAIPNGSYPYVWEYVDLLPYLASGKTVKNIYLQGGTGNPIYIDDVSLLYTLKIKTGLIARVESVLVKDVYLKAVHSAIWNDSDPWVSIPIPAGEMIKQHLKPSEIEGVITSYDVGSVWEAFYDSGIINESTSEKTKFSEDGTEFVITLKDIFNNDIVFIFYDVRVTTIQMAGPELEGSGEGMWIIRWTARKVVRSVN